MSGRLLPARIRVPSSSRPGTRYLVVVNPSGVITCSCPADWNRRLCRHIRALAPAASGRRTTLPVAADPPSAARYLWARYSPEERAAFSAAWGSDE